MQEELAAAVVKHVLAARAITIIIGAGVSTAAGIPSFRGSGGIHNEKYGNTKVKDLMSLSSISRADQSEDHCKFVASLAEKSLVSDPTEFHRLLGLLHRQNKIKRIYTQNIDSLESKVGFDLTEPLSASPTCVLLHGSLSVLRCTHCPARRPLEDHFLELKSGRFPTCEACKEAQAERTLLNRRIRSQGILRADIVLYEEVVPNGNDVMELVSTDCRRASDGDLLLVVGTSLQIPGVVDIVKSIGDSIRSANGQVVYLDLSPPPHNIASRFTICIQYDCQKLAEEIIKVMTADGATAADAKYTENLLNRQDMRPLWDWI